MNGSPSTSARFAGACGRKSARSANSTAAAQHATTQYPDQTPMPGSRQASQSLTFSGHVPYRGLFPSPPLFDRMPTYRTQGKRSLNFLSAQVLLRLEAWQEEAIQKALEPEGKGA